LSSIGFATAHVGKWHLGVGESHEHLPTRHGFDSYLGIPYSHDMCPCVTCFPGGESCLSDCHDGDVSCPLFDGEKVAEQPVDLATLTEKYTAEATRFIKTSAEEDKPFFLYLAFHQTHHPQFAGSCCYRV
jgi:arylsulfatase A